MILESLQEPSLAFLDPSKRIFWGSLLGSLLLILLISGRERWQHLRTLCSLRIWLHPSSRADGKIILANSLLRLFLFPSSFLTSAGLAALVSWSLTKVFGGKPDLAWSTTAIMISFSITIFLVDDLARYLLHVLQHRWRFLWFFHQVLSPFGIASWEPTSIPDGSKVAG